MEKCNFVCAFKYNFLDERKKKNILSLFFHPFLNLSAGDLQFHSTTFGLYALAPAAIA